MVDERQWNWKGDWLYFSKRKIVRIVPDEKYPNMWRIERPDGKLTDMVNKTRAKDAALSVGLQVLKTMSTAATDQHL